MIDGELDEAETVLAEAVECSTTSAAAPAPGCSPSAGSTSACTARTSRGAREEALRALDGAALGADGSTVVLAILARIAYLDGDVEGLRGYIAQAEERLERMGPRRDQFHSRAFVEATKALLAGEEGDEEAAAAALGAAHEAAVATGDMPIIAAVGVTVATAAARVGARATRRRCSAPPTACAAARTRRTPMSATGRGAAAAWATSRSRPPSAGRSLDAAALDGCVRSVAEGASAPRGRGGARRSPGAGSARAATRRSAWAACRQQDVPPDAALGRLDATPLTFAGATEARGAGQARRRYARSASGTKTASSTPIQPSVQSTCDWPPGRRASGRAARRRGGSAG